MSSKVLNCGCCPQLGVRSKCNVNVWKVFTFWRILGPLWAARNWWVGLVGYSQYSHLTVPAAHWYVHVAIRPKWTNYEYFPLRRHIWARRDHLGPAGGWPSQSPLGSKPADSRILCFIIPEICPNWSSTFQTQTHFKQFQLLESFLTLAFGPIHLLFTLKFNSEARSAEESKRY